jgi:hypothetical protein
VSLLVGLGFFEGRDLRLGQDQTVLGDLGLERFQPLLHGLQVVAQPDKIMGYSRDSFYGSRISTTKAANWR